MRPATRIVTREAILFTATAMALVVVAALVYSGSNSGVVGLIDSGELMAVVMTGGVAHPTGYPLFALVGYCLAPWASGSPASILPWLSHAPAALTVGLVLWSIARCCSRRGAGTSSALSSAGLVALAFALSRSFWLAAGEVEVYSLTALLTAALLVLGLEGLDATREERRRRIFLLFSFGFGLAAGNHLSVLAAGPMGLALLARLPKPRRLGALVSGAALTVLGYTIVLQLPIRAAASPLMNWGDPSTLSAFARHIRGAQYQVWMFTRDAESLISAAGELLRFELVEDVPALAAIVVLALPTRRLRSLEAAALAGVIAANLLLTLNYDIPDIRSYLIPGEIALALLAGISLARSPERGPILLASRGLAFALIVVAGLASRPIAARADYTVVDDYARTLLTGLEPNAILLTDRWDAYSAAIYLQRVEEVRRDVALIDKELLRRSWYYDYLAAAAPEMHKAVESDVRAFLRAVAPFEAGEPFDPPRLQRHFVAICRGLLSGGPRGRPGYALLDNQEEILQGSTILPGALAWRVFPPGIETRALPPIPARALDPPHTPPTGSVLHDERAMRLANEHGRFANARGRVLGSAGLLADSIRELERATRLSPLDPHCHRDLAAAYRSAGREDEAARMLKQARRLAALGGAQ
ncbi:MAG: hypothetical protein CME06_14835 [Gemmatimonadetes bacterium]|nr:hypothetical protein [Gemmatimonadota bacterium]